MNDTTLVEQAQGLSPHKPPGTLARRLVLSGLARLSAGRLRLVDGAETWSFGPGAGPGATHKGRDPAF